MGCAPSRRPRRGWDTPTQFMALVNDEIDERIKEDEILQQDTAKLLLLGSSDSGKSTLVKQMKILHVGGFSEFELKNYRFLVFRNIVDGLQSLVKAAADLNIAFDPESKKKISLFFDLALDKTQFDARILDLAAEIWNFPKIQACFAQKHMTSVLENVEYYFTNLPRIASDFYIPNNVDILHCRSHTSGVYCTEFSQMDKNIKLIDVGGQKSERRKWIHCFDDVTAILFVAALSGYDQVLEEKPTENRMFDALALFDEICKNDYFTKTAIVLFLNKKDIFEEKIKHVPLTVCFTDYTGGNDCQNACQYISNQFVRENTYDRRDIYIHFTNATDTQNIEHVFKAVIDTVIGKNMGCSGIE